MIFCFINGDYSNKYNCQYTIDNECINVEIMDDIRLAYNNGEEELRQKLNLYDKRDILIVDLNAKRYILVKNAMFISYESVINTLTDGYVCYFRGNIYFENKSYSKLMDLAKEPQVSTIRVYSKIFNRIKKKSSIIITESNDDINIKLEKHSAIKYTCVNKNNISKIGIDDTWGMKSTFDNCKINYSGYIEIQLQQEIAYNQVHDYINELIIYFELLYPSAFSIDHIRVNINNDYYNFSIPINNSRRTDVIEKSVHDNLLSFLEKCYTAIPYHNTDSKIKDLLFIYVYEQRNLEDNFLMLYRFIEFAKKKQNKNFIFKALKENKIVIEKYLKNELNDDELTKLAFEIVKLRNYYVHEGYFIKDNSLEITVNIVENIDVKWIYTRKTILNIIVNSIVFKDFLGYDKYIYNRFTKVSIPQ